MAEKIKSRGRGIAVLLLIDLAITAVILYTDKNVQTDFGTVKPYFIHWYGLGVTALVDLIGAIVLLARPSRGTVTAAAVGSLLLALFLIGDIATYSQVGFSSPLDFARYLFGIVKYPGTGSYIPGLYDALFAFYVITSASAAASRKS